VGIKPKIIERAKADGIGVLILCERLTVPGYGIKYLGNGPGLAAVALVIKGAVIRPAGFLRRCMERNIFNIGWETPENNFDRLDGAIQVLVVDGVLIMVDPITRACYFVADEENAVVARIGFDLINRRICPCFNGWLHAHRRTGR
jgi:hypothetical protein